MTETLEKDVSFLQDLKGLINKHSKENGSDTPDFVLAVYLNDCLTAFDMAVSTRDNLSGKPPTRTNI